MVRLGNVARVPFIHLANIHDGDVRQPGVQVCRGDVCVAAGHAARERGDLPQEGERPSGGAVLVAELERGRARVEEPFGR